MSEYIEQSAKQFQSFDDIMNYVLEEANYLLQMGQSPHISISPDVWAIITNTALIQRRRPHARLTLFGYPVRIVNDAIDTCIVEGYKVI